MIILCLFYYILFVRWMGFWFMFLYGGLLFKIVFCGESLRDYVDLLCFLKFFFLISICDILECFVSYVNSSVFGFFLLYDGRLFFFIENNFVVVE